MTSARRGGLGSNLALALLSAVVALGAVELALRAAGYDRLSDLRAEGGLILRPSSNPDLAYELVPGASGDFWGTQVSINAHGFRGRMDSNTPFDGFRIIALGDSITFG